MLAGLCPTYNIYNITFPCVYQDPPPTMETIESILPTICKILTYGDKHVLSDACWALSYITDGNNDRIGVMNC